jgi:hypothetical protein
MYLKPGLLHSIPASRFPKIAGPESRFAARPQAAELPAARPEFNPTGVIIPVSALTILIMPRQIGSKPDGWSATLLRRPPHFLKMQGKLENKVFAIHKLYRLYYPRADGT